MREIQAGKVSNGFPPSGGELGAPRGLAGRTRYRTRGFGCVRQRVGHASSFDQLHRSAESSRPVKYVNTHGEMSEAVMTSLNDMDPSITHRRAKFYSKTETNAAIAFAA